MARLGSNESGLSILQRIFRKKKKVSEEQALRMKLEIRDKLARTKMMNERRECDYKNALIHASKYLDTGTVEEKRALRNLKVKKRALELSSRIGYMMEYICDTFELTENLGDLSNMITDFQTLFSSSAINSMNPKQMMNNVQGIAQKYKTTVGQIAEYESIFDSAFEEFGLKLEDKPNDYLEEIEEVRRFKAMQEPSDLNASNNLIESVNKSIQELRESNNELE